MAVGHAERDIRQALAVWMRSQGLGGCLFSILYTLVTAGGGGGGAGRQWWREPIKEREWA